MKIVEFFSVNNDCYKSNVNKADSRYTNFQNNGPRGLMLHSVGCPQSNAWVFANMWNRANYEVAVHAVLQADGIVFQCLPWNFRGWHAGGSANNTHIGVEMSEPDCIKYIAGATFTCSDFAKAKAQVEGTYKTAVELFAMLCTKYDLDPMTDIISHKEGASKGVASGHVDPEHLWTQLKTGYTMDTFRKAVKAAMSGESAEEETTPGTSENDLYRVRKAWTDAKSQLGAFKELPYAKSLADKNPGYNVYDDSGYCVYSPGEDKETQPAGKVTVKEWQTAAIADGYKFPVYGTDGVWGAECLSVARKAVVKKRLIYTNRNLTKLVQRVVGVEIDGKCGNDTDAAIRNYQRKNGLTVDGAVGENTWRKILGV